MFEQIFCVLYFLLVVAHDGMNCYKVFGQREHSGLHFVRNICNFLKNHSPSSAHLVLVVPYLGFAVFAAIQHGICASVILSVYFQGLQQIR